MVLHGGGGGFKEKHGWQNGSVCRHHGDMLHVQIRDSTGTSLRLFIVGMAQVDQHSRV